MIDFQALKHQLELLGHRLPDTQIKAILADMQVEVDDSPDVHKDSYQNPGHSSPPAPTSAAPLSASRPPRRCLASELDESCPPTPDAAAAVATPQVPLPPGPPPPFALRNKGSSASTFTHAPVDTQLHGPPSSHQRPFLSQHTTSDDAFLRACASPVSASSAMPSQGLHNSGMLPGGEAVPQAQPARMPSATTMPERAAPATPLAEGPGPAPTAYLTQRSVAVPQQPYHQPLAHQHQPQPFSHQPYDQQHTPQLHHQYQHRYPQGGSSTSDLGYSGRGDSPGMVAYKDGGPGLQDMRVEAAATAAAAAAAAGVRAVPGEDKENQGVTYPANLSPLSTHSQPLSSNAYSNSKNGSSLPGGMLSSRAPKDGKHEGAGEQKHEGSAWWGAQAPSAGAGDGVGGGVSGGATGGFVRGGSHVYNGLFSGDLRRGDVEGRACSTGRAATEGDEEEIEEEEGLVEEEEQDDDEEDVDEGVDEILAQYYGARAGAGRGALRNHGGSVGTQPRQAGVGNHDSDASVYAADAQYAGWAGSASGSRGGFVSGDMREGGGGGFGALSSATGRDVGPSNEVVHTKKGGSSGVRRGEVPGGPHPPSASLLRAVADGAAPMQGHLHQPVKGTPPPRAYGGSSRLGQQQPSGSATRVRSPESVSGLSLGGRSSIARSSAGTLPGSARPGSAAKIDRVTRYKQLQQGWSKDKFLSSATHGSRPSSAPQRTATTATKRKPLNFHAYYQMMHAAEAEEKKRVLSQARAKTVSELSPGAKYVSPADKRRDGLRWEMRMKMAQY